MSNAINNYLGSGITFPIQLNSNGGTDFIQANALIRSSILAILSWPMRTRFFTGSFGCRLWELVEEPNDDITNSLAVTFITEALERWEKRISILDVTLNRVSFDRIDIQIRYLINNTRTEESFIYPFYKELNY